MSKEHRVRIVADHDPMDPRGWENASRMICWHPRRNLGDDHNYDCDDFLRQLTFEADADLVDRVDELETEVWEWLYDKAIADGRQDPFEYANQVVHTRVDELIKKAVRTGYVILPLYLYDHSGITMSTGPFGCIFDSGQVGWIVCDNETIKREWDGDRELAEEYLRSQVEVYDDYLTGNVYGFVVEEWDGEGWECVDSCFGFYGHDIRTNGMADHLDDELIDLAEAADIEY